MMFITTGASPLTHTNNPPGQRFLVEIRRLLAGNYTMTPIEQQGYNLFRGKVTAIHAT